VVGNVMGVKGVTLPRMMRKEVRPDTGSTKPGA
jgi:hypothetical protein